MISALIRPAWQHPARLRICHILVAVTAAAVLAACGSPEKRAAEYMQRAQELYAQGNYVKARIEAQNAVQIAPRDAAAHYLLAQIAEKQQDFRTMFQRLTLAVDADPKLVPARVKLGTLYFFGEVYDKAGEQAKAATALAPDDPDVRVLNARLLLRDKQIEPGIRELDAALARNPDLVDALLLKASAVSLSDPAAGLGILDAAIKRVNGDESKSLRQLRIALLAQQNRKADVEQAYRDLIREFPKDEEFQYQLARLYSSEGRLDEAEQVMRGVVKSSPDDVNARLGLAQFLAQMRSPEAAQKALESFIAESPNQPELRLALGRLYEVDRKPEAALAVYEELAKRDPRSKAGLEARVRTAVLRIGMKQMPKAVETINGVLADEPDYPEALLMRAGFRVQDKKYDDAIADVRTVLRKDADNVRAKLLMARTYALMGNRVLAKDTYRNILKADPKNADASRELVTMELLERNPTAAEQVLRERLAADPNDLESASRLVELLAARKAWGEAEAEARKIDAMPDSKGLGQFQLARLYRAQGKNAESAEMYRKVLEKNPQSPFAIDGLVVTLQSMGRDAEARRLIEDYRQKYPDDIAVQFIEGSLLVRQGDTAGAQRVFSDIVKAQPKATMAWVALGSIYRNEPAQRIDVYKRGLAANPGNADLGLLLGTEYEQARRYEEAIALYESLLKTNPDLLPAMNNLASLLCDFRTDQASYARALELAKRLESNTNPAMLDTVGWAYYRNKDYARALQFIRKAVDGAKEVPMLRYHLGMAYLANGNKPQAQQELQYAVDKAKADFPGLAEARQELARLSGSGAKG